MESQRLVSFLPRNIEIVSFNYPIQLAVSKSEKGRRGDEMAQEGIIAMQEDDRWAKLGRQGQRKL